MKQILNLIFTGRNRLLKSLNETIDRLSIYISKNGLDRLLFFKAIYRASLLLTIVATPTLLLLVFFSPSKGLAVSRLDFPTPTDAPEDDSVIKDITPPVITVLGDNPLYLELGELNYNGAIAWDNVDGNVTADIITIALCNENIPSTCTEIYKVEDKAGNLAIAYRLVIYGDGGATSTASPTSPTATPKPYLDPYPSLQNNPSNVELVSFRAESSLSFNNVATAVIIGIFIWLILLLGLEGLDLLWKITHRNR